MLFSLDFCMFKICQNKKVFLSASKQLKGKEKSDLGIRTKNICHKEERSDLVKATTQCKELHSKTQSMQKVNSKLIVDKS